MQLYVVSQIVKDAQAAMARAGKTDRLHYCYRCHQCGRLITKLEILEARSAGRINLCPCGSRAVRPTNAHVWEELLLPRCWKLIYAIQRQLVSPPPLPPTPEEQAEAERTARQAMRAFDQQMADEQEKLKLRRLAQ